MILMVIQKNPEERPFLILTNDTDGNTAKNPEERPFLILTNDNDICCITQQKKTEERPFLILTNDTFD